MVVKIPRKAKSPPRHSAKEIIAELNAEIDEVLSDYRDLPNQVMAGNKKKVVKQTASKSGKSKTKIKALTPKSEKWMTESHLFGKRSKLPNLDLHSWLARPESWGSLDENEKATLKSLLPETTIYNDDGSPSQEFLKYNTEWRNAVRQFQDDIISGRMDPEWQADALQAMEERAAGEFDQYKEDQYEEFWGQKQKVVTHHVNGGSSKVSLEELVNAGLFKVGDTWSYSRLFHRHGNAFLVEKEATIGQVQNGLVVVLLPPGQYKHMPDEFQMNVKAAEAATFIEDFEVAMDYDGQDLTQSVNDSPTLGSVYIYDNVTDRIISDGSPEKPVVDEAPFQTSTATIYSQQNYIGLEPPRKPVSKARIFHVHSPGRTDHKEPQILRVKRLNGLERKILEIDGRAAPNGRSNAWKYIRCIRDGKDIGALNEIREAYYARHSVSAFT